MKELNFDLGYVTYKLNGKCEITINPTDSTFVEDLFRVFDDLDKKQESYKEQVKKTDSAKEVFAIAKEMDSEMRKTIDALFDAPVCDSVFGAMNVYAMADGLPVWANLMLAIIDEIDTSFAREQKATNARVKKYTSKYRK